MRQGRASRNRGRNDQHRGKARVTFGEMRVTPEGACKGLAAIAFAGVVFLGLLPGLAAAAPVDSRLPVPSAAAQAKAEPLVNDIFQREYL